MSADFHKKKQYGQNFLVGDAIPKRIAFESGISKTDGVIEIGPGFGILTRELCAVASKVVAIEIDSELIGILNEKLDGLTNVKVINADILKTDLNALVEDEFQGCDVCVCANLPYYITSETVMKLLECGCSFKSITVMVQKEVADRFCSSKSEAGYGAITVAINYRAEVKKLFPVKLGSFNPKPKVDSAVIKFVPYKHNPFSVKNEQTLFRIIKAAFSQRRKTLSNAVYSSFADKLSKQQIAFALVNLGLNENIRGEELDISEFCALADLINDII